MASPLPTKNHHYTVISGLLVAGCLLYAWYFQHNTGLPAAANPDAFMRLARLEAWHNGQSWFDLVIHRDNTPHGAILQWTHPVDILLLLIAHPLSWLLPFSKALHGAAFILPPFLLTAHAALLLNIARRISLSSNVALTAIPLLVFTATPTGREHIPLTADHHALLALLASGSLYALLCWQQKPDAPYNGARLSMALATGLWVAPEFMLVIAITFGWMLWCYSKNPCQYRPSLRTVSTLTTALLFPALFLELASPLETRHDSLSIVHISALALATITLWLVTSLHYPYQKPWHIIGLTVSLGGAGMRLLTLLFPDIAKGPFAHVSPLALKAFHTNSEYQPLWYNAASLTELTLLLLMALPALWQKPQKTTTLLLLWALTFAALSMMHGRWSLYAIAPAAILASITIARWTARHPPATGTIMAILLGLLPATACHYAQPLSPLKSVQDSAPSADGECLLAYYRAIVNGSFQKSLPHGTTRVAMHNMLGTYLLYYTPLHTLTSISHRNGLGFTDWHTLQHSPDHKAVKNILQRRKLDILAFCLPAENGQTIKGSLLWTLEQGRPLPQHFQLLTPSFATGRLHLLVIKNQ